MKKEFANFMLDQDFKSAAELIIAATLKINVPKEVAFNINFDREKNIEDLSTQMKNCYDKINDQFADISFEKLWTGVFTNPMFTEKQNLKDNELLVTKARTTYDKAMDIFKVQQFEQIFEATTLTTNAAMQGLVDASLKI
jgi:hypothetical protein